MEVWKSVKGWESNYQVSNHGRLKIVNRGYYKDGSIKPDKIMKQTLNSNGYIKVMFENNGSQKCLRVHRLICEAFIPNPENKTYVNHINGIKHDNRIENLEWCTSTENQLHAIKTGLKEVYVGENAPNSKLKNDDIPIIFKLREDGYTLKEIGKRFNVSHNTVSLICRCKMWSKI